MHILLSSVVPWCASNPPPYFGTIRGLKPKHRTICFCIADRFHLATGRDVFPSLDPHTCALRQWLHRVGGVARGRRAAARPLVSFCTFNLFPLADFISVTVGTYNELNDLNVASENLDCCVTESLLLMLI